MYIKIYYTYIHIYIHRCICVCVHMCIYTYIHVYTCVHLHINIHIRLHIYLYIYIYIRTCIHTKVYIYKYIYTYVYIYITYTHTLLYQLHQLLTSSRTKFFAKQQTGKRKENTFITSCSCSAIIFRVSLCLFLNCSTIFLCVSRSLQWFFATPKIEHRNFRERDTRGW